MNFRNSWNCNFKYIECDFRFLTKIKGPTSSKYCYKFSSIHEFSTRFEIGARYFPYKASFEWIELVQKHDSLCSVFFVMVCIVKKKRERKAFFTNSSLVLKWRSIFLLWQEIMCFWIGMEHISSVHIL